MEAVGWVVVVLVVAFIVWDARRLRVRRTASGSGTANPAEPVTSKVRGADTREAIIERHLSALRDDYTRRFYEKDATAACIAEILASEGQSVFAPRPGEWLYRWRERADVPVEYRQLADSIERRVRDRMQQKALSKEDALRQAEEAEAAALKAKHADLVHKFLSIAQRKVSTVDEYGDENWKALPAEVRRCVEKIAEREQVNRRWLENVIADDDDYKAYLAEKAGIWRYRLLIEGLTEEFKRFHANAAPSANSAADLASLTGPEFEAFIAQLLKALGYQHVRGTPASGDQGADLIAERDGRSVVIQAKRYKASVGNKAVQEVIAALSYYRGQEGWVVTNSTFTPSARALANSARIRLVDGHELGTLIAQAQQVRSRKADA